MVKYYEKYTIPEITISQPPGKHLKFTPTGAVAKNKAEQYLNNFNFCHSRQVPRPKRRIINQHEAAEIKLLKIKQA